MEENKYDFIVDRNVRKKIKNTFSCWRKLENYGISFFEPIVILLFHSVKNVYNSPLYFKNKFNGYNKSM